MDLLTKNTAIIVVIGIVAQIRATLRHEKSEPSKNTMKMPMEDEIPAQAERNPRIDGSLSMSL